MLINIKPIYKRILLKLSGEILQSTKNLGININILNRISQEIKELVKYGVQIGIIIGGGNLFRGAKLASLGINRITCDHVGMLSTIINGLIVRDFLNNFCVNNKLMSAIPLEGICNIFNCIKAIELLNNNYVLIFIAGTGNPLFTTDSAACLRSVEIKAEILLKATKVDGVFSDDPIKCPNALLYKKLSYHDVLKKELKIMDSTAFAIAKDHNLPICVFNIKKSGFLKKILMGQKIGTLITN